MCKTLGEESSSLKKSHGHVLFVFIGISWIYTGPVGSIIYADVYGSKKNQISSNDPYADQ